MLLDPADTRLELADDHAMADDGRMVVDHRAAKSDNLLAELPTGGQHIGGDVSAKRVHVGGDVGTKGLQIRLRRHLCPNLTDVRPDVPELRAHLAQKLKDEARGSSVIGRSYHRLRPASVFPHARP
jgi:hypothetical protein